MSHLDEGTLHALLDGELGSTEVLEIEAHLDGCAACSARLRDAREFLGEADRLVGRVQFGRFAGAGAPAAAAASPASATAPRRPPPPRPGPAEHQPWEDTSPVLLIPDNPTSGPAVRSWPRLVGWAATVALALGGGYLASNLAKTKSTNLASAPQRPTVPAAESRAVASPAETERFDSGPTNPPGAATTARRTPAASAEPKPPRVRDKTPPRELATNAPAPAKAKPAQAAASPPPSSAVSADEAADQNEEAATKAAEQEAIRLQATRALSQLDRERLVGRAAAATAALDRTELDRRGNTGSAAGAIAAPAPPPPTLEQRAQVYLRIGLDEANRQLGGPVHVIEGMSPVFMGLAPGRVAAGADTTRPVVRVVYQDPQGRMILLDQQRRATQTPAPAGSGAWTLGSVIVGLRGEAPAEVLRSLRPRVR